MPLEHCLVIKGQSYLLWPLDLLRTRLCCTSSVRLCMCAVCTPRYRSFPKLPTTAATWFATLSNQHGGQVQAWVAGNACQAINHLVVNPECFVAVGHSNYCMVACTFLCRLCEMMRMSRDAPLLSSGCRLVQYRPG